MEISHRDTGRAWRVGDFLFDLRSAHSGGDVSIPRDKLWTTHMCEKFEGGLAVTRCRFLPKTGRQPARGPIENSTPTIKSELDWRRFPPHATVTWSDARNLLSGRYPYFSRRWSAGRYSIRSKDLPCVHAASASAEFDALLFWAV